MPTGQLPPPTHVTESFPWTWGGYCPDWGYWYEMYYADGRVDYYRWQDGRWILHANLSRPAGSAVHAN
jgi:hypothetical protein